MLKALRWFNMTLVGSFLFAGLCLMGWGWGDWNGFLDDDARLAYVALTITLQGWVAAWIPDLLMGQGRGRATVERQRWVIPALQLSSLALVLGAPYCDRRDLLTLPFGEVGRLWGLPFVAGGFLLMNWAVAALGRQFSVQVTLQEGHRLVTEGPFKLIRHPRYSGILFFFLGISLVFRSGFGILLTGFVKLVLLWRIRDEERMLEDEFGETWKAYASRTWRLVPWVW